MTPRRTKRPAPSATSYQADPTWPASPTRPSRPPINEMTPGALRTWIQQTREGLERKMARERAYLDRRAARGTHTPTDEAYEADQLLEADMVALLDEFEQHVGLLEHEGEI